MPTTEKKNSTKQIIADTALRLFVMKGYHHTSITDIVAESGLSTGAVYHHFDSKETIARYIHDLAVAEFADRFTALVESRSGFKDKLFAYVKMMLEWDDENPDMVKYLISDRPAEILDKKTTVCSTAGMKSVGEIVLQGLTSQEIALDNYFVAISLISGTIIHFISLRKDGYIQGSLADKSDDIARHIYNGLRKTA